MCQTVHYRTSGGHLSTPNFPVAYPPNKHCTCRLQSINSSDEIRLDFTHFLIKYDLPCRDWVEIYVNGVSKRLCGSHRLTAIGTDVIIQFHSDDSFEHQGLWCQFSSELAFAVWHRGTLSEMYDYWSGRVSGIFNGDCHAHLARKKQDHRKNYENMVWSLFVKALVKTINGPTSVKSQIRHLVVMA